MKRITNRQDFMRRAAASLADMLDTLEGLADFDCSGMQPEKICILSIDMNKGFTRQGVLASPRVEELVKPTAAFLKAAMAKGIQVTAFSDRHTVSSAELASYPEHCTAPQEYELVEELQRLGLKPVWKNSTNAFMTGMDGLLTKGYDVFIVTGCCTDICIYQCALALRAFLNQNDTQAEVVVPLSLVETYDGEWHNADLMNLVFLNSMAANGILLCEEVCLESRESGYEPGSPALH